MSCGIYQIRNLIDGKRYIGQSINIERRWKDHRKSINCMTPSYNNPLYRAIRKYKVENFVFEILETCKKEELDIKEKKYIQEYDTIAPQGYNLTEGGENTRTTFVLSDDDVEEIQKLLLTSRFSQQEIANGFNISQTTISDINIGDFHVKEGLKYPLRPRNWFGTKEYYCLDCQKSIAHTSIRCKECHDLFQRRVERPSREVLKNKIKTIPFVQIGQEYGVSDNAIKRWCKAYNLPYRKTDINKYSSQEWGKI